MKKIIILFICITTLALNIQAEEQESLTKKYNIFFGNHLDNIIVESSKMFVVIHNPTEFSLIVMNQEANKYCQSSMGNKNYKSLFMKVFGKYTAYFSCELTNKIDEYNLLAEEKECITSLSFQLKKCDKLNNKNADIIKSINQQVIEENKYKEFDFIYSVRNKIYDKLILLENVAEQHRINKELYSPIVMERMQKLNELKNKAAINELSSDLVMERMLKTNQLKNKAAVNEFNDPQFIKKTDKLISFNKEICIKYGFEKKSDWYKQCLLNLIAINQTTASFETNLSEMSFDSNLIDTYLDKK